MCSSPSVSGHKDEYVDSDPYRLRSIFSSSAAASSKKLGLENLFGVGQLAAASAVDQVAAPGLDATGSTAGAAGADS